MTYPQHLLKLIAVLKNLPGVGSKSAERFAFHLLDLPPEKIREMGSVIHHLKDNLKTCGACGALVGMEGCPFCDLSKRQKETLCIVANPKEIFLIEETKEYRGLYHVLKGTPQIFQRNPSQAISLEPLKKRIVDLGIKEVILAFDSTVLGDGAALFVKKELSTLPVTLSRIAFGIPLGSSLDLLDGGTLGRALQGRQKFC